MKKNVTRCIVDRTRKIYTDDTLEAQLQTMKRLFIENYFPSQLSDKVIETEKEISRRVVVVEKKPVCMSLPFKSKMIAENA